MIRKILLRYLIFVGIPYFIARKIEKQFWKYFNPEVKANIDGKSKKLPDIDNDSAKISEYSIVKMHQEIVADLHSLF